MIRKIIVNLALTVNLLGSREKQSQKKKIVTNTHDHFYSDVVGPLNTRPFGGSQYFVILSDAASELSLEQFTIYRIDTVDAVNDMIGRLEGIYNSNMPIGSLISLRTVRWLGSDSGGEYVGAKVSDWLISKSIVHEASTAYSERSN